MFAGDLESLKVLIAPFTAASKSRIEAAFEDTFTSCPQGLNEGDYGHDMRVACLKHLPSLGLPTGVVTAQKDSKSRPKNTTRIVFAVGDDVVIEATVNCVKRKRDRVYELTKQGSSDASNFESIERLIDVEDVSIQHYMIGVNRAPRPDGSVVYTARFLAGRIDFDKRLFYADVDELITTLDTQGQTFEVSRRTYAQPNTMAEGPAPELKRRERKDDEPRER